MAQQSTKFIANNAVTDTKARLDNNQYLRARNAANSADINIIKVNASDKPEFGVVPQVTSDPSAANDLVRKSYADGLVSSSITVAKQAVDLIATSNITLSGEQTIDGSLTSASRVLVAGQSTASQNGIYVTSGGAWARSTDADASAEVVAGMEVMVLGGTSYKLTKWFLFTSGSITLGSTSLTFKQVNEWAREAITLTGTDITNQYVTLASQVDPNSIDLMVDGGGVQRFTADYTHSVNAGVSRLTFAGDLATGGGAALASGDILRVKYIKRS